jgi:hypothetical protein
MDKDDDKMEELYDIIEEIVEEVGEGKTNTIIKGDWNSVVGVKSYRNVIGPRGLRRRNQRGKMFVDFEKEMDFLSPTHGLKGIREDCTAGKYREFKMDISLTIYL